MTKRPVREHVNGEQLEFHTVWLRLFYRHAFREIYMRDLLVRVM